MSLDLPRPLTPFPQKGPRSSHATSPSVRKWERRRNAVRICGKYPFNRTKGWHSIIALCSITTYVLRCSKLPLTLLWVSAVSRSRLGPCCVLQMLHKHFRSTEWFILHLYFVVNQKRLCDREHFVSPVFRVLKNTDQIFTLWKFCKKHKVLKNRLFQILLLAKAAVARSFIFRVLYKTGFHSSAFFPSL